MKIYLNVLNFSLLLSTRFLNHCERFQGHIRSQDRKRVNDAFFIAPFKSLDEHVQLEVTAETFMTSRKPIQPFNIKLSSEDDVLPDIFPIKPTISIPQFNFYNETCVYRKLTEFSLLILTSSIQPLLFSNKELEFFESSHDFPQLFKSVD